MLLKEFFSKSLDVKLPKEGESDLEKNNDLFWFFVDHDRLHKDYVMPLASKIKKAHQTGNVDHKALVNGFMPMVNRGCMEYYHKKKLEGRPEKLFPKEMREEMCQRLYDHFCDGILKDEYKV